MTSVPSTAALLSVAMFPFLHELTPRVEVPDNCSIPLSIKPLLTTTRRDADQSSTRTNKHKYVHNDALLLSVAGRGKQVR